MDREAALPDPHGKKALPVGKPLPRPCPPPPPLFLSPPPQPPSFPPSDLAAATHGRQRIDQTLLMWRSGGGGGETLDGINRNSGGKSRRSIAVIRLAPRGKTKGVDYHPLLPACYR